MNSLDPNLLAAFAKAGMPGLAGLLSSPQQPTQQPIQQGYVPSFAQDQVRQHPDHYTRFGEPDMTNGHFAKAPVNPPSPHDDFARSYGFKRLQDLTNMPGPPSWDGA